MMLRSAREAQRTIDSTREQNPQIDSGIRAVEALQQSQPILGPMAQHLVELSKSHQIPQPQKAPLGELAALAETLNSESDELNATIQTINEKLSVHNLGVEVWCEGPDGVDFGFCRVGDPREWQLAARHLSMTYCGQGKKEYQYEPLLKRSRNERIQGLEFFPEIRNKLKEDAERKIAAIRKAKQFAASL